MPNETLQEDEFDTLVACLDKCTDSGAAGRQRGRPALIPRGGLLDPMERTKAIGMF